MSLFPTSPKYRLLLVLLVGELLLLGCSPSGQSSGSDVQSTRPVSLVDSPHPQSSAKQDAATEKHTGGDTNGREMPPAEFKPPFPGREGLFVQPNAGDVAKVAKQRAGKEQQGQVTLKGFINAGQAKALLDINGQFWAAEAGAQRHGVSVVSITPPGVTLRRDSVQWTLSLKKDG